MTSSPGGLDGVTLDAIDNVPAHICVLDGEGTIVATNKAWDAFGAANSVTPYKPSVGTNYLTVCSSAKGYDSDAASMFAAGLRSVLTGNIGCAEGYYTCDSPTIKRWFVARAHPIDLPDRRLVVTHTDVTEQKRIQLYLAERAATDPVTGLPDRGYFISVANAERERIRRFRLRASLLVIELDHLASLVASQGHAAGEDALGAVATVCKRALRKVDLFARVRHSNLATILLGADVANASVVAERVRRVVAKTAINCSWGQRWMTTSMGLTEIRFGDHAIDDALIRADRALHDAVTWGRNCVVVA